MSSVTINADVQEDLNAIRLAFDYINQNNDVPAFGSLFLPNLPTKTVNRVELADGVYVPVSVEMARVLRYLRQRFDPISKASPLVTRIRAEVKERQQPERNRLE